MMEWWRSRRELCVFMLEKGYTRGHSLALGMIQYRGERDSAENRLEPCVWEGMGQSPSGQEKQGSLLPVARGKVRKSTDEIGLRCSRCESVGVPDCFCFLSDAGGSMRWGWAVQRWVEEGGVSLRCERDFSLRNTSSSGLSTGPAGWSTQALHCPTCYWFCISVSFTALIKLRILSKNKKKLKQKQLKWISCL